MLIFRQLDDEPNLYTGNGWKSPKTSTLNWLALGFQVVTFSNRLLNAHSLEAFRGASCLRERATKGESGFDPVVVVVVAFSTLLIRQIPFPNNKTTQSAFFFWRKNILFSDELEIQFLVWGHFSPKSCKKMGDDLMIR